MLYVYFTIGKSIKKDEKVENKVINIEPIVEEKEKQTDSNVSYDNIPFVDNDSQINNNDWGIENK